MTTYDNEQNEQFDNRFGDRFDEEQLAELRRLWRTSIAEDSFVIHDEALIEYVTDQIMSDKSQEFTKQSSKRFFNRFTNIFERISPMSTLAALLQNRKAFIAGILTGADLRRTSFELLAIAVVSFFLYGFVLGIQHSIWQGLASAVKLPLLFLLTIIITLPTLFIFGSLIGTGRTFMQTIVILLAGTTIIALVLVALSPVTLLFGMTTSSYAFFKLLNVGIFVVAWFLGAAFFRAIYAPPIQAGNQTPSYHGTHDDDQEHTAETNKTEQAAENHNKIQSYFIRFWFLLYGFVAVQIAWMLRPFVCSSSMEFQLFRGMRDNVYGDIIYSIAHILGLR
jgi:hypothetical protein